MDTRNTPALELVALKQRSEIGIVVGGLMQLILSFGEDAEVGKGRRVIIV
jgi:hypothetical protein